MNKEIIQKIKDALEPIMEDIRLADGNVKYPQPKVETIVMYAENEVEQVRNYLTRQVIITVNYELD